MMDATRRFLEGMGLPPGDLHELPDSTKRFPDGAQYRVEIPSTEGPAALAAILEEADAYHLTIHRVSQGSGVLLMTDDEIRAMARLAKSHQIEISLFARPNAAWDIGAMATSSAGKSIGPRLRGQDQLVYCLEEVKRAASLGIRSVLLADEGALWVAAEMRQAGILPTEMQFKISVMMASANPASIRLMERLGADTFNIPTDLTLGQIAAIRQAVDIPLDVYWRRPMTSAASCACTRSPNWCVWPPRFISNLACAMLRISTRSVNTSSQSPWLSPVSACAARVLALTCSRVTIPKPSSPSPAPQGWPFHLWKR